MKRHITLLACAAITLLATAQTDYTPFYESVKANNPSLRALLSGIDATVAANHTGLTLENPEVEFGYQWGNSYKINIDVSQTFDFPTLLGSKKRVAEEADKVAHSEYGVSVSEVLYQTDVTLTNIAYYKAAVKLYEDRYARMAKIDSIASAMLKAGRITKLETTRSKLELEKFRSELDMQRLEYEAAIRQLDYLNGDAPLPSHNFGYDAFTLPTDFDSWFNSIITDSPELALAQSKIAMSQKNIELTKDQCLPNFMVGYTNELMRGDNHHGFKIGTSIPLWGNSGAKKAAKAEFAANQTAYDEALVNLRADLRAKYDKAAALKKSLENYRNLIDTNELGKVLEDAFKNSRLNIYDYLSEYEQLSEMLQILLEKERDYHLALCELKAATLH